MYWIALRCITLDHILPCNLILNDIVHTGVRASNQPSLMNVMMELRKCCNHPYLLRYDSPLYTYMSILGGGGRSLPVGDESVLCVCFCWTYVHVCVMYVYTCLDLAILLLHLMIKYTTALLRQLLLPFPSRNSYNSFLLSFCYLVLVLVCVLSYLIMSIFISLSSSYYSSPFLSFSLLFSLLFIYSFSLHIQGRGGKNHLRPAHRRSWKHLYTAV